MDETTSQDQQLLATFENAPPFIRAFVEDGEFSAFVERLADKFSLETGLRARISNELLMTLLGITSPTELPDNLRNEAGVPEAFIPGIIEEAREGIFEPLIARGGGEPAPDLPMVVPASQTQPAPVPVAAAISPLATFHVEAARAAIPQTQAAPARPPMPAAPPRPVPPPPRIEAMPPPVPPQPASAPSAYDFHARTMASDIEAMQPGKGTGTPRPPSMPARPAATPPVSSPITAPKPPAPPVAAAPSAPSASEVHADLRQYGVDPYREPIE